LPIFRPKLAAAFDLCRAFEKWQRVINLVGAASLDDLWVRHFADSLQVSEALPEAGDGSIWAPAPASLVL